MAHKGTSTFIVQRASAVVLIPLVLWVLVSVVGLLGADEATARAWFSKPLNGFFFASFLIVGAWHMRIGLAEIIADYIHSSLKSALGALNWLLALAAVAVAVYAAYTLSFAG